MRNDASIQDADVIERSSNPPAGGDTGKREKDGASRIIVFAPSDVVIPPTLGLPGTVLESVTTLLSDIEGVDTTKIVQLTPKCAEFLGLTINRLDEFDISLEKGDLRVVIPFGMSDDIGLMAWQSLRASLPTFSGFNDAELESLGKAYAISNNDHGFDVRERPDVLLNNDDSSGDTAEAEADINDDSGDYSA